jgi:hypothetical protein
MDVMLVGTAVFLVSGWFVSWRLPKARGASRQTACAIALLAALGVAAFTFCVTAAYAGAAVVGGGAFTAGLLVTACSPG